MRALTVVPGRKGSLSLDEVDEPDPDRGTVLVKGLAVGYVAPTGGLLQVTTAGQLRARSAWSSGTSPLGKVREAPASSGFAVGDLIVGVVRRPDPVPCEACACGLFDMCRNGRYTERGIKEIHGYASELWRVEPEYAVRLDAPLDRVGVLIEPTTVVTRARQQVEKVGSDLGSNPRTS